MLKEQKLHIRGKQRFKIQFLDLLYLQDTDDEIQMEEYAKDTQKVATN